MKEYSILIKPASASCNLNCKYCFYCDVASHRNQYSFGVMSKKVMKQLIDKSLSEGVSQVKYSFQGGEPTLAGLPYFEEFVLYVEQRRLPFQKITYAIQTNGYEIDESWFKFFKQHRFLVGVSLDGFAENHDNFRVVTARKKTYTRVYHTIQLLKAWGIDFNILCVLTKQLAKQPLRLYQYLKAEKFQYIQIIPCLPKIGVNVHRDLYALTPQLFESFYNQFYQLWKTDALKGHYMSISFFDDLIPMFFSILPQQCGMLGFCSIQFVVEANGDVYPCDFYAKDKYLLGNVETTNFDSLRYSKKLANFLNESRIYFVGCEKCEFNSICKGNCKVLNVAYFDNEYCGYYHFIKKNYKSMIELAKKLG